jgi:hypothetical protein
MVLASMRAGNTRGDLWAIPQDNESPLILLWDKANNGLYIEGEHATNASIDSLAEIVAAHIRPRAVAAGRSRFKVHTLSPSLDAKLHDLLPGLTSDKHALFFFQDGPSDVPAHLATVPNVALVLSRLSSLHPVLTPAATAFAMKSMRCGCLKIAFSTKALARLPCSGARSFAPARPSTWVLPSAA